MKFSEIIFIERLTVVNLLLNLVPYVVSQGRQTCCWMIVDCTPLASVLLRLLPVTTEAVDFRIEDLRVANGSNVRLQVYYQTLERVIRAVDSKLKDEYPDELTRRFLLKQLTHYYYSGRQKHAHMVHALLLVEVSQWYQAHRFTGLPVQVWLYRRWFFDHIVTDAKERGITVKAVVSRYLGLRLRIKKYLGQLLHWFKQSKSASPLAPSADVFIATDYYGHLNLDKPQCYSDLFFCGLKHPLKVKIAFNIPSDPLTDERLAQLQSHGIEPIIRNARADQTSAALSVEPQVFPNAFEIARGHFTEKGWIKQKVRSFEIQKAYWKQYLLRHNIRLYMHWFKFDETHIPLAAALKETGGIMTLFQRAYESHPTPEVMTCADIVFGFHPSVAAIERANGSAIAYHVAVGYAGDFRFEQLKSTAKSLREKLLAQGVKHIIAFLDENTIDDGRWFYGHGFTQKNYEFVLRKILVRKDWGLILKPKVPRTLRVRLGPTAMLLDELLATGRCILIEEGTLQGAYPPAVAALAADVTVHEFANAATAGLEAMLCHKRTVLMDLEGWPQSPFAQAPEVVFDSWEQMWQKLEEYLKDPSVHPNFGNCESLLGQFDPYIDGKAALRIHEYVYFLQQGLQKGENNQELMVKAAKHFANQWGQDKVTYHIQGL